MKNEWRTSKNGWKSSRKSPRKPYGSASAWIFFTEPIFFTNFKWFFNYQEDWTKFSFTSPPIYRKMGEMLATQLAQASKVTSSRSNRLLEESSGGPKWAWLLFAPPLLLNTPLPFFFCDSFSVKLRKLTNFVTILVFFRNVTEPCGLYNHPPFDLRNVT